MRHDDPDESNDARDRDGRPNGNSGQGDDDELRAHDVYAEIESLRFAEQQSIERADDSRDCFQPRNAQIASHAAPMPTEIQSAASSTTPSATGSPGGRGRRRGRSDDPAPARLVDSAGDSRPGRSRWYDPSPRTDSTALRTSSSRGSAAAAGGAADATRSAAIHHP